MAQAHALVFERDLLDLILEAITEVIQDARLTGALVEARDRLGRETLSGRSVSKPAPGPFSSLKN